MRVFVFSNFYAKHRPYPSHLCFSSLMTSRKRHSKTAICKGCWLLFLSGYLSDRKTDETVLKQ